MAHTPFHVFAALWAIVAIALVGWLAPPAVSIPFGLAGVAAGYLLGRRRVATVSVAPVEREAGQPAAAEAIARQVLPAWGEQLGSAREEGNRAVESLVGAFEDLAAKTAAQLEDAQHAVNDLTSNQGALPALRATRSDLDGVLEAMRRIEQVKESILAEAVRAGDLSGLAGEVRQIALQSKLLAMNAGIEAARAADSGHAFAVVAREMRDLAERSARTSEGITQQVAVLTGAVQAIRAREQQRSREAKPIELAEAAIEQVGMRVEDVARHLVETARRMEQRAGDIRRDVSDSLVALQFQDRVSQILAHTARCIADLRQACGEPGYAEEPGWRERLARFARKPEGMATLEVARRERAPSDVTFF